MCLGVRFIWMAVGEEERRRGSVKVERMQIDVDNTKSELTQAINRLSDKMDAGFRDLRDELKQEIQSAKQEFGNTRNWQISCVIAAVIAVCAVAGLLIK